MPEPIIPSDRLKRAGASDKELAQLESEFERSDLGVQTSLVTRYESMSEGALRDNLDEVRDHGHFEQESSKPDEGTEESMAASDDPDLDSGATEDDEPPVEKKAAPRKRTAASDQ